MTMVEREYNLSLRGMCGELRRLARCADGPKAQRQRAMANMEIVISGMENRLQALRVEEGGAWTAGDAAAPEPQPGTPLEVVLPVIEQLRGQGATWKLVANSLNSQGFRTVFGRIWTLTNAWHIWRRHVQGSGAQGVP